MSTQRSSAVPVRGEHNGEVPSSAPVVLAAATRPFAKGGGKSAAHDHVRSSWRAVAVPSEHGGWGLTLEPVVLGLLIAPSVPGLLIGLAAFVAFAVRTPLKLAVIDVRRGRWLDRSSLALRFAVAELALLTTLATLAWTGAGASWLLPILAASPFIAVEMWFEVRSRGRRLVPEVCGAVAISSVAPAMIVAADGSAGLAAGAWLLITARAVATIPFVRAQIARMRRRRVRTLAVDVVQGAAVVMATATVAVDHRLLAGGVGVAALAVVQSIWVRRPPVQAKVLGLRELALGLALVALTGAGFWVS